MTGSEYSELFRRSEDEAYRALFDEYGDYVYTIVYSKLHNSGSREDIEECVSDVFAKIFFSYDTSAEYSGDMKEYIGTIAKRTAVDAFRRTSTYQNRISGDEDAMLGISSDNDIEKDSDAAEVQTILMREIEALGEPDSTIIIQKFYFDRNSNEIAEMLSMKASAVRMRCKRAMSRLGEKLTQVGITL